VPVSGQYVTETGRPPTVSLTISCQTRIDCGYAFAFAVDLDAEHGIVLVEESRGIARLGEARVLDRRDPVRLRTPGAARVLELLDVVRRRERAVDGRRCDAGPARFFGASAERSRDRSPIEAAGERRAPGSERCEKRPPVSRYHTTPSFTRNITAFGPCVATAQANDAGETG